VASANAHDLEISHIFDSAATGLVGTVVAVDVVVDKVDSGGETDGLCVGVAKFKNVGEDLCLEEVL
jgi:hypothetical protein